ncbi:GNAT family N-acetyltransferase [Stenotrophomonas lactitubi]|uniref:GNAT family N-acetyltransferase n=1 Tax=Stenotrophomonas lactitubi TaxID=2045214 RepID=UPI000FB25879
MLIPASAHDVRALLSCTGTAEDAVAPPEVIAMLADLTAALEPQFAPAAWRIVDAGRTVGLLSLTCTPQAGVLTFGYGIAPAHQGRGLAGAALAEFVQWAWAQSNIHVLAAETAVGNLPSQAVLRRNGFRTVGQRVDAGDGVLLCWQLDRWPKAP